MGALYNPEPVAFRYAVYIDELSEFFAGYELHCGSPEDMLALADRLGKPGPFAGDFSLIVRSIIAREGGYMSRAELLEVVSIAIGGPEMDHAPKAYQGPLSQLFAFITEVGRRPVTKSSGPGQLVPFPVEAQTASADSTSSPYGTPGQREIALHSSWVDSPRRKLTISPSFRNLLIAGTVAVLLAVLLGLILRPHAKAQAASEGAITRTARTPLVYRPKPTPYGEAFSPTQPPARKHRAKPQPAATPENTGQ